MRGYVPLRRGLYAHLSEMTDPQVKLYVALLLQAVNSGPNRGVVRSSLADLAGDLGWSKSKAHRTLDSLSKYVSVEPSTNRHTPTVIRILRFHQRDGKWDGNGTVDAENGTVNDSDGTVDGTVTAPKSFESSSIEAPERYREEGEGGKARARGRATPQGPPAGGCSLSGRNGPDGPGLPVDAYEQIERLYPKAWGKGPRSRAAWQALMDGCDWDPDEHQKMLKAALMVSTLPERDVQFLPSFEKWLRDKRYLDKWGEVAKQANGVPDEEIVYHRAKR